MKKRILFLFLITSIFAVQLTAQTLQVKPSATNQTLVEPLNTKDGVFFGQGAGVLNGDFGFQNSFIGYQAGNKNVSGTRNVYLGYFAGHDNLGSYNTIVGHTALSRATAGANNTMIGYEAGFFTSGSGNIFIGHQAGKNQSGSDKLFIHNTGANSDEALIYGEFNTKYLRANSVFDVYSDRTDIASVRAVKNFAPGTNSDIPGIYGENAVDNFYGVGVDGKGGYIGTRGTVTGTEDDSYYGVWGQSSGTNTGSNYGVQGVASGSSNRNYGIYGAASGTTDGKVYGVYGTAGNLTDSWAGYFSGKAFVQDSLAIGIQKPARNVHIWDENDPTILLQSDGTSEPSGRVSMRQSNSTGFDIFYDGGPDKLVFEGFSGTNSEGQHMTIDYNTGNVGIGTTADANSNLASGYKLSVNGKIAATEVRVQPTADWPDYVFANDYKLMPINEVKKSIEENNHLPGIPSAKEVEENGIEVGEMQRKMMEKIEELTLYVIQLKEEIDVLRQAQNDKK